MAPNYDQESKFYANSNLGLSRMIEQEYRKSKPWPWGGTLSRRTRKTRNTMYERRKCIPNVFIEIIY